MELAQSFTQATLNPNKDRETVEHLEATSTPGPGFRFNLAQVVILFPMSEKVVLFGYPLVLARSACAKRTICVSGVQGRSPWENFDILRSNDRKIAIVKTHSGNTNVTN